jgi:hypothetical protein
MRAKLGLSAAAVPIVRPVPPITGYFKGCKLGYDDGKRDITKAKCKMKVCCFSIKKQETCDVCPELQGCDILADFHDKNGYKYRKYKESLEFIKANGYAEFVERAKDWKRAYGKL